MKKNCQHLLLLLFIASSLNIHARLRKVAPQPVRLTMRDGSLIGGKGSFLGSRPLTISPTGEKRQRKILLSDILIINHKPEKMSMEKPWTFKESGRAEKIYFPEKAYPLINFTTTITLVNGTIIKGHIISAIFEVRTPQGEKKKIFLKRQIKGKKGQRMEDVKWLQQIRFTDNKTMQGKAITGSIKGFGKLLQVNALDIEHEQIVSAKIEDDNFDFGILPAGKYELAILTDSHVLVGFSAAVPTPFKTGDTLQDGDLAAINKQFPKADDFFNDRWILSLAGNRSFAKTLIYKRRANYYDSNKITPGGFVWHVDVWSWHLVANEWKIDHRYMLIRHKQKKDENNRILIQCQALQALEAGDIVNLKKQEGKNDKFKTLRNLN